MRIFGRLQDLALLVLLVSVVLLAGCTKTVPDVVGHSLDAAITEITGADLTLGVVTQAYNSTVAPGMVVSQTPAAGAGAPAGSAVALRVSQGASPLAVPDAVGMSQAAASAAITGAGLTLGLLTQAYSATVAPGIVIGQVPVPGTPASPGAAVAIIVSAGPPPVWVLNVAGQTQAAAFAAITGAGLTLGTVTQQCSDTVAAGRIISQTPAAGEQAPHGSAVALVVSTGFCPVTLPNVAGQTAALADAVLTAANLGTGAVTQQCSDTVAAGLIISQVPAAGERVPYGSAVALVVSTGFCPVTVPNVVGQTEAAAGGLLAAANLGTGAVTQQCSESAAGLVISQVPAAAEQVPYGSAVALVVSTGFCPVTVPNVVGQTEATGDGLLTLANLGTAVVTQQCSDTVAEGLIISQNPAAGELAPYGSTVAVLLSTGFCPVTVPNVVGQTAAAAGGLLAAAKLSAGAAKQECSDTVAERLVISQVPAAGQQVAHGSAVALVVSTGYCPVTVPNVVGQPEAAAGGLLILANLGTGVVTQQCSDMVAAGLVISQIPAAEERAPHGSAVALAVSTGFCPVTVPNVVGRTEAAAVGLLAVASLGTGAVMRQCSDTVAAGLVIRQIPAAGKQTPYGGTVDLVLSTGERCTETIMLPGEVPLTMVWIPGGSFMMGRYPGEQNSNSYEDPQHSVTLSSFWMGKYELTKRQWTAVMGTTPWTRASFVLADLDSPAFYMSWNDAQSFLPALNSCTGKTFRLPSEAEWEYACRAGTTTRFYWGDDAGYTAIGDYAWYLGNCSSQQYEHVVGQRLPNAFGLYDMSGNMFEWCQDWWHGNYSGAPTDGSAWESPSGLYRVLRGGSWFFNELSCRSANRYHGFQDSALRCYGFRVSRTP